MQTALIRTNVCELACRPQPASPQISDHERSHHFDDNPRNHAPLASYTIRAASKIPEGVKMSNLQNALRELREKRHRAQMEVEKLNQVISGIESLNGTETSHHRGTQPTRVVSAASRRKMALAQKARWANIRKQSRSASAGKTATAAPAKRIMSASARRKIAAAQKARWAKVKAQQKAA